jgi:hypothetical protein
MKNLIYVAAFFLISALSGCELIGDIFKAGAYTALIGVVIVVAIIIWVVSKFRR